VEEPALVNGEHSTTNDTDPEEEDAEDKDEQTVCQLLALYVY
jgi:hypothetical protein